MRETTEGTSHRDAETQSKIDQSEIEQKEIEQNEIEQNEIDLRVSVSPWLIVSVRSAPSVSSRWP